MTTSMMRCHWKSPKPKSPRSQTNPDMARLLLACITALVVVAPHAAAQTRPDKDYLVYVLSEAADRITLVRFGPKGARVDHDLHTGEMPTDINGPHGISIS